MRCERDAFDTLFDHAPDKLQVRNALFNQSFSRLGENFTCIKVILASSIKNLNYLQAFSIESTNNF